MLNNFPVGQLKDEVLTPKEHCCDLGHVILLLSYFLILQPAFTVRKLISYNVLPGLLNFLPHQAVKDFFIRIFSPKDNSLNLCTEFKVKILDSLRNANIKQIFNKVISGELSLGKVDHFVNFNNSKENSKIGKSL